MKFIPHFSVFCANIGFFCETTKFLEEFFQLNVFHQYCVSTISQVVTSIRFLKKAILYRHFRREAAPGYLRANFHYAPMCSMRYSMQAKGTFALL